MISGEKLRHDLKNISPVRLIVFSFFIVIIIGTLLLTLPISSRADTETNPVDALFVATSASCVTGLTPFDTWTHWNYFGQAVILLLIQVGGLGMITFTTGFTLFLHKKIGLRDMKIVKEYTGASIMNASSLIKIIIFWTFLCELCGAIVMMFRFVPQFGARGIWVSMFLSISAFCNAGFDILGFITPNNSVIDYATDPLVSITLIVLIVLGGIGFLVVSDIYVALKKKIRDRSIYPRLNLHTILVVNATVFLLLLGAFTFTFVEYDNTLKNYNWVESFLASLLQSSFFRTAGFTGIPLGLMKDVSKFLSIILMFIGASPASTGGGVKTTTIVIVIATIMSVIKGKSDTIIKEHRISKETVYKALTILVIAFFIVITSVMFIDYVEAGRFSIFDIVFEVVSAYSTTGSSLGITPFLSIFSKILLSFVMLVGRVGSISLIFALSIKKKERTEIILPEGRVIVG